MSMPAVSGIKCYFNGEVRIIINTTTKETRARRLENKRRTKEYAKIHGRESARKRKLKCMEYKGNICQKCKSQFDPEIMHFHHKDPCKKEFEISQLYSSSWEKIKVELDKCILVCQNCHILIHKEMRVGIIKSYD